MSAMSALADGTPVWERPLDPANVQGGTINGWEATLRVHACLERRVFVDVNKQELIDWASRFNPRDFDDTIPESLTVELEPWDETDNFEWAYQGAGFPVYLTAKRVTLKPRIFYEKAGYDWRFDFTKSASKTA